MSVQQLPSTKILQSAGREAAKDQLDPPFTSIFYKEQYRNTVKDTSRDYHPLAQTTAENSQYPSRGNPPETQPFPTPCHASRGHTHKKICGRGTMLESYLKSSACRTSHSQIPSMAKLWQVSEWEAGGEVDQRHYTDSLTGEQPESGWKNHTLSFNKMGLGFLERGSLKNPSVAMRQK